MYQRITLSTDDLPRQWYNVLPDIPSPLPPPKNPQTGEPVSPDDLAPIFPMALIEQEVSPERWIAIPEEILEVYSLWRPTPLHRASRLEKALGTPAEIFYKNESVSPPGSHKPNTAVAQAFYNKQAGIKRLTTETGAGQWGSALSFGCNLFGLECMVYMVRVSFEQKPYRKFMMQTWNADVVPSPSDKTNSGRKIREMLPDTPGSLVTKLSTNIARADPAEVDIEVVKQRVTVGELEVVQEPIVDFGNITVKERHAVRFLMMQGSEYALPGGHNSCSCPWAHPGPTDCRCRLSGST